MVGCVFNIWDSELDNCYEVNHIGFEDKTYYIGKCDCEIVPEPYTYADVDLPEWWDGRRVQGWFWNGNESHKDVGWCVGIDKHGYWISGGYIGTAYLFRHFVPIPIDKTTAKVSITRNGETTEVELTDDQIRGLKL